MDRTNHPPKMCLSENVQISSSRPKSATVFKKKIEVWIHRMNRLSWENMSLKIDGDSMKTVSNVHTTRHQVDLLKPKNWTSFRTPRAKCRKQHGHREGEEAGCLGQRCWTINASFTMRSYVVCCQSDWSHHSDFNSLQETEAGNHVKIPSLVLPGRDANSSL